MNLSCRFIVKIKQHFMYNVQVTRPDTLYLINNVYYFNFGSNKKVIVFITDSEDLTPVL